MAAPNPFLDPCGAFLPALIAHDVLDRLRGERKRARARWGKVERPAATGKLLWVVAGATRQSVRLGVELARAILARRRDLSIALTFECEYPELLGAVESEPRIACGYAPADYAGAMHAVWHHLLPFGVILAGVIPRPNLIRLSEACRHALLVSPPGFAPGRYERIYPGHRQIYEGRNVAPASDLEVLMLPSAIQDDAGLGGIAAGRTVCLWHGSDADAAKRIYALFRGHLPHAILLASGPATATLARHTSETIRLSAWAEQPVPPDKLVLLDDPAALAALMPNMIGAHFDLHDKDLMWLALAAGACVSVATVEGIDAPGARSELRQIGDENTLIDYWRSFDADPRLRVQAAASARQAFAAELSAAQHAIGELLARVSAW